MASLLPTHATSGLHDSSYGFPSPPIPLAANDAYFIPQQGMSAMPSPMPAPPPAPTVRRDEYISYYFKYVRELQYVFAGESLTNLLLPVSVPGVLQSDGAWCRKHFNFHLRFCLPSRCFLIRRKPEIELTVGALRRDVRLLPLPPERRWTSSRSIGITWILDRDASRAKKASPRPIDHSHGMGGGTLALGAGSEAFPAACF